MDVRAKRRADRVRRTLGTLVFLVLLSVALLGLYSYQLATQAVRGMILAGTRSAVPCDALEDPVAPALDRSGNGYGITLGAFEIVTLRLKH